jgi:hypothetical protein
MRSIFLAAALLLSAPAALAQALPRPEETLKASGLYGRFAPNCSIRLAKEPLIYVERADGTEDQVRITTRKDLSLILPPAVAPPTELMINAVDAATVNAAVPDENLAVATTVPLTENEVR